MFALIFITHLLKTRFYVVSAGAQLATMYLQCYINENGDKVYTTKVCILILWVLLA